MTDSAAVQIPGFIAGTWEIDPVHSEVSFVVRHMTVSKVRARFDRFSGTIVTNEDLAHSSVNVTIDASSVDTNEPNRDEHVLHPSARSPSRGVTRMARRELVVPAGAGTVDRLRSGAS